LFVIIECKRKEKIPEGKFFIHSPNGDVRGKPFAERKSLMNSGVNFPLDVLSIHHDAFWFGEVQAYSQ
jgi:hypothetical protein